ncbi:MAG: Spy/CpxP family protein refolding chaperone [Candidatus Sumerlaeota bacterium]
MKRISTCLTISAALALSAGLFATSYAQDAPATKPEAAPAAKMDAPAAKMDGAKPGEGAARGGRGEGMRGGQGGAMGRQIFEFWNDEKAAAKLELKPEQKEKLTKAYADAKPKIEAATKKMEEMRAKRAEAPKDGTAPAASAGEDMAAIRKEMQEARKPLQDAIDSTLTEAQKKMMPEINREHYGAGMGAGAREGGRRGPGAEGAKDGMKKDGDMKKDGAMKPESAKEKAKDEKPVVK